MRLCLMATTDFDAPTLWPHTHTNLVRYFGELGVALEKVRYDPIPQCRIYWGKTVSRLAPFDASNGDPLWNRWYERKASRIISGNCQATDFYLFICGYALPKETR